MTCSNKQFQQCQVQSDCKCYQAVMRTYKSLAGDKSIPDTVAMEAAQRVYAFHFPDVEGDQVSLTVESWINEDHVQ